MLLASSLSAFFVAPYYPYFLLLVYYFHSRDQLPCFTPETKKVHMNSSLYPENESETDEHGCRSFVLGHQHGHRDVMRKSRRTKSTATRLQVCTLSYEKQ